MDILAVILLSFAIIGFAVLGIAFWAALYPKTLCQKVLPAEEEWNVCIRPKGHDDHHLSVTGKKF